MSPASSVWHSAVRIITSNELQQVFDSTGQLVKLCDKLEKNILTMEKSCAPEGIMTSHKQIQLISIASLQALTHSLIIRI